METPHSGMLDKLIEMKVKGDKKYMEAYKEVLKEFFGTVVEVMENKKKKTLGGKPIYGAKW